MDTAASAGRSAIDGAETFGKGAVHVGAVVGSAAGEATGTVAGVAWDGVVYVGKGGVAVGKTLIGYDDWVDCAMEARWDA